MQYVAYLVAVTAANWLLLRPMLFPREHPRFVAPVVVADVPDTTYHGGIL